MKQGERFSVITISREFGSGGHSIAMQLAERLRIPFYDRGMVERVAQASGYSHQYVASHGEQLTRGRRLLQAMLLSNAPGYNAPQDEVFAAQRQMVLDLAASPCIIVGRCADYILDEAGIPALHVFIYADEATRAARVLRRYGETETPIRERLHEKDEARRYYYEHYTQRRWGDAHHYHVCLNSAFWGEDGCVELLLGVARARGDFRKGGRHDSDIE